jgi:prepilin-type N-terminal cleavage/methylation domain-containing protein/prepilin-type processing-associated H-X9-DG protein
MRPNRSGIKGSGFTLVELLVVVGIITVLVALLLPALSGAREHANRVKCLATLRTMGQAAQMHAVEHRGHMPLAAWLPVAIYPDAVGDASMKKYTYFKLEPNGEPRLMFAPAPLSASLGQYMGLPVVLGTRQELQDSLRRESVYRHFTCPGDPEPQTGSSIAGAGGWMGPQERMSYLYNMRVLGLEVDDLGQPGLGGNVARVRRPNEVFLFADGQGGEPPPRGLPFFGVRRGETLFDYWLVSGRPIPFTAPLPTLDHVRHRNRINVVYVDGHGETLMLPRWGAGVIVDPAAAGGIGRVGVSMGIYR